MSVLKVCPKCGNVEFGSDEKCIDCDCYYRVTEYSDSYWNKCDSSKKIWIIKKYCPDCDIDKITSGDIEAQRKKEEERKKEKQEQEMKAAEEAWRVRKRFLDIITTTCSNIEGHRIKEYKGIVSGASVYNFGGGIFAGGYSDKGQSKLFGSALETAKEILVKNAVDVGADAVIGIQTALVVTNPLIAVTLTGTAVKTEKITEDK